MLFKIGTVKEFEAVKEELPLDIQDNVYSIVTILDKEYGSMRDVCSDDGGYILVAETIEDVLIIIDRHIDINHMESEQVNVIKGSKVVWVELLYLLNNEFGVSIILPMDLLK